jgi:N-acylglucosamine-6-phosphate 2-epimerase
MRLIAQSVLNGGAAGILAQGLADLRDIRSITDVPLIGLWKDGPPGVHITPTASHAVAVVGTGADIVAIDATLRPRPDGKPLSHSIDAVHAANRLVMANVSTEEEGCSAADLGADFVSTCLAGYTPYSLRVDGPDFDLIERLASILAIPVIAEGRIATLSHAARAFSCGAYAILVGRAITNPTRITQRFISELERLR